LPFLFGGLITIIVKVFACSTLFDSFLDFLSVVFNSWDTVKFTFATTLMSFLIKKEISDDIMLLANDDKVKEVSDICSIFFLYGIVSAFLLAILLFIDVRIKDCSVDDLQGLKMMLSVIAYTIGVLTIRKGVVAQKQFKLYTNSRF